MRLIKARVENYKSVLDAECFSVGNLTCLVGKNESGKTALLEAIEKINSVVPSREGFQITDYPRINLSDYEASGRVDVAIETVWDLEPEEVDHIDRLAGPGVLTTPVQLSKDYANRRSWKLGLDLAKAAQLVVATSGLEETERSALADLASPVEVFEKLQAMETRSPRQQAMLDELNASCPAGDLEASIETYLDGRLPALVYYTLYDSLPGRMSIDQLLTAKASGTLDQIQGSRVFLSLLSMVNTTPEQLNQITTSEQLISKLEGVQSRITRILFKYWTQNKYLKVRFSLGSASPGDPPPFNTGKVFQTRIENTRHDATINLSDRSTGFIWFFSFLVWFSEVQKEHGQNLIVLLDEPGLSLHAKAQQDLLRYINEELLPKYQVIYTTHSPFMIDSGSLLACRTVEDVLGPNDEVLGTKVGDNVLSTDRDTLFPLQAALGYDITQTMFVGKHCLLVEGPSDLLYLQWASSELTRLGRKGLDRRWTITPCGGITKVSSFMSLFGGSGLDVAVLTDHASGDKRKVRELRESDLLKQGHVFTADMYCNGFSEADTEDVLGRDFYIELVNATYELKGSQALQVDRPPTVPMRVVEEVEDHFKVLPADAPEFDHYAPAAHLIANPGDLTFRGRGAALDRFEKLFADINDLLAP